MKTSNSTTLDSPATTFDIENIFEILLNRRPTKKADFEFHSKKTIIESLKHVASSREFQTKILPILINSSSADAMRAEMYPERIRSWLSNIFPEPIWRFEAGKIHTLRELFSQAQFASLRHLNGLHFDDDSKRPAVSTATAPLAMAEGAPERLSVENKTGSPVRSFQSKFNSLNERILAALKIFDANQNSSNVARHERDLRLLFGEAEEMASKIYVAPTPVMIHKKNPSTYMTDIAGKTSPEPIVSFTSISGRLPRVKRMIESLKVQTIPIHSINLYISSEPYLIDAGIDINSPDVKDLYAAGVNIFNVPNVGPYRKQYYILKQLQEALAPRDTVIITIDDDVEYPPDILLDLVSACQTYRCVAAHRGREILTDGKKVAPYSKFRPPQSRQSFFNLATGRNGVAYQLGFFPNDPTFFVGPFLAPTADDLWCKWVTAFYCISTRILEPKAAYVQELDFPDTDKADKNSLFHKYNAKGENDLAIAALECFFGKKGANFFDVYGAQHEV